MNKYHLLYFAGLCCLPFCITGCKKEISPNELIATEPVNNELKTLTAENLISSYLENVDLNKYYYVSTLSFETSELGETRNFVSEIKTDRDQSGNSYTMLKKKIAINGDPATSVFDSYILRDTNGALHYYEQNGRNWDSSPRDAASTTFLDIADAHELNFDLIQDLHKQIEQGQEMVLGKEIVKFNNLDCYVVTSILTNEFVNPPQLKRILESNNIQSESLKPKLTLYFDIHTKKLMGSDIDYLSTLHDNGLVQAETAKISTINKTPYNISQPRKSEIEVQFYEQDDHKHIYVNKEKEKMTVSSDSYSFFSYDDLGCLNVLKENKTLCKLSPIQVGSEAFIDLTNPLFVDSVEELPGSDRSRYYTVHRYGNEFHIIISWHHNATLGIMLIDDNKEDIMEAFKNIKFENESLEGLYSDINPLEVMDRAFLEHQENLDGSSSDQDGYISYNDLFEKIQQQIEEENKKKK